MIRHIYVKCILKECIQPTRNLRENMMYTTNNKCIPKESSIHAL